MRNELIRFCAMVIFCLMSIGYAEAKLHINGIYYNILESNGNPPLVEVTNDGYGSYSGKVSIPEWAGDCHVVAIGEQAFYDCPSLTEVSYPSSVKKIGDNAFSNCTMSSFNIGGGIESVGSYLFSGCNKLKTIYIGDCLRSISGNFCAPNLEYIEVSPNNNTFKAEYGILSTKSGTLMCCPPNISLLIWPSGVNTIGKSAFYNLVRSELVLPESVTRINALAFQKSMINTIYIGSQVSTIESFALGKIYPNTKAVYIAAANPPKVLSSPISEIIVSVGYSEDEENVILYVPSESVDAYKSAEGWKSFKNILGYDAAGIRTVDAVEEQLFTIENINGGIKILSTMDRTVSVINANGLLVKNLKLSADEAEFCPLEPGYYLITSGNHVKKLYVR